MYEIERMMNNIFTSNDAFFRTFDNLSSIAKTGFSKVLKRPHNLIEIVDKDGKTTAQKIEVVTTPFKKDEVKVSIKGDTITVKCGSANREQDESEQYVYHGISSQSYTFSLKIPETIDKAKITGENKDGILTITMPVKEQETEPDEIEVKIS